MSLPIPIPESSKPRSWKDGGISAGLFLLAVVVAIRIIWGSKFLLLESVGRGQAYRAGRIGLIASIPIFGGIIGPGSKPASGWSQDPDTSDAGDGFVE